MHSQLGVAKRILSAIIIVFDLLSSCSGMVFSSECIRLWAVDTLLYSVHTTGIYSTANESLE